MQHTDPRVDAYIAEAAPFAQPILQHLRALVHKACPAATEIIKWGRPFFEHQGILCAMSAFKHHCSFMLWGARLLSDPHKILQQEEGSGMGQFGQLTSIKDLPADKILIAYIKEAAALNEQGVKPRTKPAVKKDKKELEIPDYFQKALAKNKKAAKTFADFSYTNQKDYLEWITEAKTDTTREKRMGTAIEWLAEGKTRNWKYEQR